MEENKNISEEVVPTVEETVFEETQVVAEAPVVEETLVEESPLIEEVIEEAPASKKMKLPKLLLLQLNSTGMLTKKESP